MAKMAGKGVVTKRETTTLETVVFEPGEGSQAPLQLMADTFKRLEEGERVVRIAVTFERGEVTFLHHIRQLDARLPIIQHRRIRHGR